MPRLLQANRRTTISTEPSVAQRPLGQGTRSTRAIGGLGESFRKLGADFERQADQIDRIDRRDQGIQGQLAYSEWLSQYNIDNAGDTDYTTQLQRFDKAHKQKANAILQQVNNPGAKQDLSNYLRGIGATTRESVGRNAAIKATSAAKARIPIWIKAKAIEASEVGDPDARAVMREQVKSELEDMTLDDMFFEGEDKVFLSQYDRLLSESDQAANEVAFERDLEQVALSQGIEKAIEWGSAPGRSAEYNLSIADTERLVNVEESRFKSEEAQAIKEIEDQRNIDRQKILDDFIIPENFSNFDTAINETILDPKEKLSWLTKLEARADAQIKKKKDPFLQTDPEKAFEFERKIGLDPTSVTEGELASAVGKGLNSGISVQKYKDLLERITKPSAALNSTVAKRASIKFNSMKQNNTFSVDDQINDETWLRIDGEYKAWINDFFAKNGRVPTASESEAYEQFLVTPVVLDKFRTDRALSFLLPGQTAVTKILEQFPETKEEIRTELNELPPEGKQGFVDAQEAGTDTRLFLNAFQKQEKPLTLPVAQHFLNIANGNREKAIELANKWNYK